MSFRADTALHFYPRRLCPWPIVKQQGVGPFMVLQWSRLAYRAILAGRAALPPLSMDRNFPAIPESRPLFGGQGKPRGGASRVNPGAGV